MADSSDSISVDMETIYLGGKVSGPLDSDTKETIIGNALFRLQSDIDDPHTFADLFVSSSDPILLMRACAYYPNYGWEHLVLFSCFKRRDCLQKIMVSLV
uniref:Uncharacterized protein n=1 Tax=Helianthus annuus TaxID=4232 RepID=A0A251RZX1_HELAN